MKIKRWIYRLGVDIFIYPGLVINISNKVLSENIYVYSPYSNRFDPDPDTGL